MTRPELPAGVARAAVRFVANQPEGAPCWRVEFREGLSIVVHAVKLIAPAWTELAGQRGSIAVAGRPVWEPGEQLILRVE